MRTLPFQRIQSRQSQGAALVLVLCFVVLVAGLMVAFLARTTTERQISNASASGTKVELMAATAMDIVVDDLKQEIINNSTVNGSGTNSIYIPKSATYSVPVRSETIANLIRRSSYSNTATRAANSASTAASLNGRAVSLARWNSHYLLPMAASNTAGETTPDSSFTAPDWVVVARSGPVASATWNKNMADSTASNTSYVIGRYAYAIYDEGGLLDINAAGYPSNAASTHYGPKGGLSYADLKQISLTSSQIDQIVGWRNYATIQPTGTFPNLVLDTTSADRYKAQVTSSTNSFLNVSGKTYNGNTDHVVMNRQQLIKLVQGVATTTAAQTKAQTALQKLGTFTREINGPTWAPTVSYTSPYDYKTAQYGTSATVYNPFILNPKVKTAFTRNDGSTAVVGEPLVKYRFPLEKLALLEKMKGTSSLSSQDVDDIARYFGLDPVTDSNGYFRHWSYPTTSSKYTHTSGVVLSLNEVVNYNREPDFFEIIQAGILAGSLAKSGRGDVINGTFGYTSSNFTDADSKMIFQVLRIGANIIDQWDTDNYPTTITIPATNDSVYGIEDLPYINKFLFNVTGPGQPSSPYTQTYKLNAAFQLWNPHQYLSSNTGAYPSRIQLSPLVNSFVPDISDSYQVGLVVTNTITSSPKYPTWYWNGNVQAWTSGAKPDFFSETTSKGVIDVSISSLATDYREPAMSSAIALKDIVNFPPDTVKVSSLTCSQLLAATSNLWIYFKPSVVYRIQYMDESGVYRTYGTFVGLDNSTGASPGTGYRESPWLQFSYTTKSGMWYSCPKSDPRTCRFGSSLSADYSANVANLSSTPGPVSTYKDINSRVSDLCPFIGASGGSSDSNPYRIDRFAFNDPSSTYSSVTNPAYADRDAKIRMGDAYNTTVSPLYNSSNGGTAVRPVILNRPFRSVGELGYVYRDMPWKTLDLFSATSADAALLDLFSLNGGQSVLAGRLNPNTRQREVLAAVIAGATQGSSAGTNVSDANALAIADAMIALSTATPFSNRADLVTRLMADSSLAKISGIKTEREAVIRAIADCANTRTWNLLIDLVAQVGRYPTTASALDKFIVDGERHYWLHLAIDRYTGQIVDQQLEVVRE